MADWRQYQQQYAQRMANVTPSTFAAQGIEDPAVRRELSQGWRSSYGEPISMAAGMIKEQQSVGRQKAENSIRKQMQGLEDKYKEEQDRLKGKLHSRVKKPDGGFDFLDADKNPISAMEYAQAKGESLTSALEGSDNPSDWEFLEDYKQVQSIMSLGTKGFEELKQDETELQNLADDMGISVEEARNVTSGDYIANFRKIYPHVFGIQAPQQETTMVAPGGATPTTPTTTPTATPTRASYLGGTATPFWQRPNFNWGFRKTESQYPNLMDYYQKMAEKFRR